MAQFGIITCPIIYPLSWCKVPKKSLEWILTTIYNWFTRFGAKFKLKTVFPKYLLLSHWFTHSALSLCIVLKKSLVCILRTISTKFLKQLKCPIWHQKEFFRKIDHCKLCLLMVPYHCKKFQKDHLHRFEEQGIQRFFCPIRDKYDPLEG